jgi:hypothetical protein
MEKIELLNYRFRLTFYPFVFVSNKINWRWGRPFKGNRKDRKKMGHLLQPGMVILTHKEYEFTNIFIRGYWTHAAMVISSDQIVEATSDGVKIKLLEDFLASHDDYVVLKPTFCDSATMQLACEYVRQVLGYPYNFRFMPGGKAFYCAELVYWAYYNSCNSRESFAGEIRELNRAIDGKILNPQEIYESKDCWERIVHMNTLRN